MPYSFILFCHTWMFQAIDQISDSEKRTTVNTKCIPEIISLVRVEYFQINPVSKISCPQNLITALLGMSS